MTENNTKHQDVNLENGFTNCEDAALLWLHRNIVHTLEQYKTLPGTEGECAQQFGVPLWKIVAPAIERELASRSIPYTRIQFPEASQRA